LPPGPVSPAEEPFDFIRKTPSSCRHDSDRAGSTRG
jgi:hypothetical protein